jgi:hypothetical protein
MKPLLLLVAVVAAACGENPLQPTPSVTLGIQLVTNQTGQPIAGEPVTLVTPTRALPGLAFATQTTNASGRVSWRVPAGDTYPVLVRGTYHFAQVVVVADASWLLSLPE